MHNFNELLSIFKSNKTFLITSHVNPDADAIGSELAIAGILDQLGKKYFILNTSSTPYTLQFLDPNNIVTKFEEEKHAEIFNEIDVSIFLDLNSVNRTVRMDKYFRKFDGIKVCIDHHTNPEEFADLLIIDESKSSTGELIFDFIDATEELWFTKEIGIAIYSAIMTDTGSFRFSKTTPALHRKIAKLLELGLQPEVVYDQIYNQYEFSRIKLLGEGLHSISLSDSGEVSYMIVTQESIKSSGGIESDVDGFVNFALTTKGVKIGILFFELSDGIKISFRSIDDIPVSKLAEEFGGGGHLNASGTRLHNVKLEEVLPKVLLAADNLLKTFIKA
jgi:bifunctional oligoribonuclease and PAP phosphatase NrnA